MCQWCRSGWPQRAARQAGRTLAQAAGKGSTGGGSVEGVRDARRMPSAAVGDVGRQPRGRQSCTRATRDLAGARLPLLGLPYGPEAAPGGLGLAWLWPTATPGPAGASAALLRAVMAARMRATRVYARFEKNGVYELPYMEQVPCITVSWCLPEL